MMALFLILDAGSGAGRSLVVNERGETLSSAYHEWSYQFEADVDGASAFDAPTFWETLLSTAEEALRQAKVKAGEILAVAVTSLREGVVFIDAEGRELYSGSQFDERARQEGEALARERGDQIYFTCGTYPPTYGYAARLRWFATHRPWVYQRIAAVLTMGDWIFWKLCGELRSEPSLASSSGLFDISQCDWSWELVDSLGVPRSWLPPLYRAGCESVPLRDEVAARLGLSSTTPVTLAGGDTQCAMLGMGLYQPGQAGCVAGSTSPIQYLTEKPLFDADKRTWSNCHIVEGMWTLESNAIATGLPLRWLRDHLSQGMSFDELNVQASAVPLGSRGVKAYLGAEIMDIANYRASWLGGLFFPVPPGEVGLAELYRAILEGNAYATRGNVEQIGSIVGKDVDELHLCGGQTEGGLGVQIMADVLGMPLLVHRGQCAAIGAAACAAVASDVYDNLAQAAQMMHPKPSLVEPSSHDRQRYQLHYENWLAMYPQIRRLSERFE